MATPKKPKLISGGHRGAEAEFGRAAKRHGIAQTTLSFKGHAMEWPVNVKVMTATGQAPEGDVSMQSFSSTVDGPTTRRRSSGASSSRSTTW